MSDASEPRGGPTEAQRPSLAEIAEHVPVGFECRPCGGSAYNWLSKCARYAETGATCCPAMRDWVRRAIDGEETPSARMAKKAVDQARMRARTRWYAERRAWNTTWTIAPPAGRLALQEADHGTD